MFVWRLTRKAHSDEPLNGEGARRYGGRWNHVGTAVVYCSASLSLSVLEYLVNLSVSDLPSDLVSIQFQFPDNLPRTEIHIKNLPKAWRSSPALEELKDIGSNWVRENKTALLVVPSVVIPNELNYVINPAHEDSKAIRLVGIEPFTLDPRLYASNRPAARVRTQTQNKRID